MCGQCRRLWRYAQDPSRLTSLRMRPGDRMRPEDRIDAVRGTEHTWGNFQPSLDVILTAGGLYARFWVLPIPVFWMWVSPLFPAHAGRPAARTARQSFHLSAQLLFGMELDWMGRGTDLGI